MKLRRRLVAAVTLLTLVTLGGAFAVVSYAVNRSQERQLDEALLAAAREEAAEAAAAGGEKLMISDRPGPAANDVGPLTKYGAIYREDGKVVAATATFAAGPPPLAEVARGEGRSFDLTYHGEHLRAVMVALPDDPRHHLLLAASRADLDGDAAFLARAFAAALGVAVLWVLLVSSWIIRRLTGVHERIAEVAHRVAAGDLRARVGARGEAGAAAQLAREVDHMLERLSTLVSAQRAFIAHAAHELRSPVSTLLGELSHALRKERDAAAYRAALDEALDSARRLRQLTEDLLTLARLDAETEPAEEEAALGEVLDEALRSVAPEAARAQVQIDVSGAARTVRGRRPDLERLYRNLIENAVHHSPPGGTVRVTVCEGSAGVVVAVADEGRGVAAEDRERIFEPFYRGARARAADRPGAGLGLAIARGIARAHGGDVRLAPSERGARFEAWLP